MSEGFLLANEVTDLRGVLLLLLGVADASEEVSNLVRIHARSRHLDGTSPVEIVVAQGEGQLLELNLAQVRLVLGHEEVRWSHAALSTLDGHQEEVEFAVG